MTATRKFMLHKRGDLVEVLFKASDRFRQMGSFAPLGRDRIVGVDTESLTRGGSEEVKWKDGKLETVLVPLHFSTGEQVIEVHPDDDALELMIEAIHERYSLPEERPSRMAQRSRNDEGKLHGRREVVDPVLLVFFNLPYDIGRLCAKNPRLLRALVSGAETYEVPVGRYDVEVARMVLGAGSSLEWFVRANTRITRLLGIDMHGYWKSSLAAAAKAVGVSDKIEIDKDWYTRPFEEFEPEEWEEFKRYAAGDVKSTAELYHATVDLLRTIDARVVKRTGVVPPSAPGAAARIAFAKAFDLHPKKRFWRRYPAWADQLGCDAYRGGRAFCARPGVHRRLVVRDIKSAYPYAMTQLPDPVTVRCERLSSRDGAGFEALIPGLTGRFGVLVIDGEGLDPVYPALRTHDDARGRLRGVYGKFRKQAATIPEVLIGVAAGTLRVDALRDGVVMRGENELSFLRNAMLDFFAVKNDPNNAPPLQSMGKLLANSTYGKLIEVQCNQFWVDSDVMCPPFVDLEPAASALARLYAESDPEHFDDAAAELIDRWYSFHLVACEDPLCRGCGPEPVESGPTIPLRQRMSRFKRYECGQYFMPLYAAQVTGLTSAALGLMARCTEAMQGDTDSVHMSVECERGAERFYDLMHDAGYGWPRTGLGSWSVETPFPSDESLCARIKLYSHKFADGSFLGCYACGARVGTPCECRDRPYKQAKHGFSKYPDGNAALHEAIRGILEGRTASYESRPSPRKIREALVHGLPVGEFVSREINVVAGIDPNTRISDGVCYWKSMEEA